MQATHDHLLTLEQMEKTFSVLDLMVRRQRTRSVRTAWWTWSRMCTAATHQSEWDALARRAQVYVVATLERTQVSMDRESLQRSWSIWRRRTQVVVLREVCAYSLAKTTYAF